jgi:cytoskeletal protein CcmA (bactofilin family)
MTDVKTGMAGIVYLGEGARLRGKLYAPRTVIVNGAFSGEVDCHLFILGQSGVFEGELSASQADISGYAAPKVAVDDVLMIRSTGCLEGEWAYSQIAIERGGVANGSGVQLATDEEAGDQRASAVGAR